MVEQDYNYNSSGWLHFFHLVKVLSECLSYQQAFIMAILSLFVFSMPLFSLRLAKIERYVFFSPAQRPRLFGGVQTREG